MKVGRSWHLVLSIALAPALALAQAPGDPPLEGPELAQLTLEELLEVDISAPAKVAQPVRESASVGVVIPRSQIDSYGWVSLNDILLRQPGFAPSQDFERVSVAARGLFESWNNNHLLMLVDGVPFNNTSNGWAYTWDLMPLLLMENVEIVRGPGSALYGTNATNGVVAVNTRAASNTDPVVARLRLGNAGTQHYEVMGGRKWSWLSLLLAYSHHRTRGNVYDSYDGSGRTDDDTGALRKFRVNDRERSHYVFGKVEGQGPLRGLSLQLHFHHYWDFQTGHGWLFVVPDERERARQNREMAWLRYRPAAMLSEKLQLELVVRWQRHEVDYRIKYLPNRSEFAGMTYPGGVVEIARSAPYDFFARAQAQYRLLNDLTLLAGVENILFVWPRDKTHTSNVDIHRGGTLMPFPGNEFRPIRPLFESVIDRPINNVGVFLQAASGRVLQQLASATLGVRYDVQFFEYADLEAAGQPVKSKSFNQLSPRVGLVLFPHPTFTLKALVERAFRAPAPSELFVTNSLLGNSNTEQIKPEEITTITIAGDAVLGRHLNLRADWFYQRFENQIAFSSTKNFSTNVYSRRLTGVETELLFDAALGKGTSVGGFVNYTFVHLLNEEVQEPTISQRDRLTWSPRHVGNTGVSLSSRGFGASVQGHWQGRVYRRPSDRFKADGSATYFSEFRPRSVAPWFTLDARVSYRVAEWLRLGVQATNLLDTRGYLIKTNDYPFDYQIEGIRVLGTLELSPKLAATAE